MTAFFRKVVVVLFFLQGIHLIWLTGYLLGITTDPLVHPFFAVIDYTEIPALLGMTWYYLTHTSELRKRLLYVILLNLQWFHIFWITDEFIITAGVLSSGWAFLAAVIDYLEIPVMWDSAKEEFG